MQELHTGLKSVFPFAAGSVNDWYLTHIEILTIIYLTRVITATSIVTKVNKSLYVTYISTSPFLL